MATSHRRDGRITSWKDDRGFGFITPHGGGGEVFVHVSAFANRARRPAENDAVTFLPATDENGRVRAVEIRFVGEPPKQGNGNSGSVIAATAAAGAFLSTIVVLVVSGRLPPFLLPLYLSASVVAFAVYAWDKSSARNARWRTQENTLHLLGLAGGWPGALVARHVFRHKSKKRSFIAVFWATIALNSMALVWMSFRPG